MNKFCSECNRKDQYEEEPAEWVYFEEDKFRCSGCDALSLIVLERGAAKNFCPNCGRKMIGVRKAPVYHVNFDNHVIYAGTFNPKDEGLWYSRTECTDEALCAVRDYLIDKYLHGLNSGRVSAGIKWETKDGRHVYLKVSVED